VFLLWFSQVFKEKEVVLFLLTGGELKLLCLVLLRHCRIVGGQRKLFANLLLPCIDKALLDTLFTYSEKNHETRFYCLVFRIMKEKFIQNCL